MPVLPGLRALAEALRQPAASGPLALIAAEDDVWLAETIAHHMRIGFAEVFVLCPEHIDLPAPADPRVRRIGCDVRPLGGLAAVLPVLARAGGGRWIHPTFNAEFLFFPFCEGRAIADFVAFALEERREAVAGTVVDIYPADLAAVPPEAPDAQPLWFDRLGYVGAPRRDPAEGWAERAREIEILGGLRRRFEEHVPFRQRDIARTGLFRAGTGAAIGADGRFAEPEINTRHSPWHRSPSVAIASLRAAKALQANPESRAAVRRLVWPGSEPFRWSSEQLLQAGLMEAGQWF